MTKLGWKLEHRREQLQRSLAGLREAMRISNLPRGEMELALNLRPEDRPSAYAAMTGYFYAKCLDASDDMERTIAALSELEAEVEE